MDGSGLARRIFTSQRWSEQPCVRPLSAVHVTAGHNALRGSGPGQKHAFEDAMALVGCPDRRIDRHCITCCSPSQPLRHAGVSGAMSLRRERGEPKEVRRGTMGSDAALSDTLDLLASNIEIRHCEQED